MIKNYVRNLFVPLTNTICEILLIHTADFKYSKIELSGNRIKSVMLCHVSGQHKSLDFWQICGQKSKQLFIQEWKVSPKAMTFTFCCP